MMRLKDLINDYQAKILQRSINLIKGEPVENTVTYQLLPSEAEFLTKLTIVGRYEDIPIYQEEPMVPLSGTHYYLFKLY